MIKIAESVMLIVGLCILIGGKVHNLQGWRARVVGIICLLPLLLSFLVGSITGTILIAQGKQVTREWISSMGTVIEGSLMLVCAVAVGVWLSYAERK